jgi:hypothetical protein
MDHKISYQIVTGPMEEDWLVAEILYGKEQIGDLIEWGEKLILYPKNNGELWKLPVDEFLETIRAARERVRFIPKDHEDQG